MKVKKFGARVPGRRLFFMVGGAGLEPATSSASRKRSSSELTTLGAMHFTCLAFGCQQRVTIRTYRWLLQSRR